MASDRSYRATPRILCALGLALLTGCASNGGEPDFFSQLFGARPVEVAPPSSTRKVAQPRPMPPAPEPVGEPTAARRPATGKRPAAPAESQTAAVAVPGPADLGPGSAAGTPKLVGLNQQETVALLGAPTAQFDRPPAKVWHYQGADCTVEVFFYLDLTRNEFSALRYTAVGADGTPATGQPCLNRIRDVAQRK